MADKKGFAGGEVDNGVKAGQDGFKYPALVSTFEGTDDQGTVETGRESTVGYDKMIKAR